MENNKPHIDSHPELPLDPDAAQPGSYKWPPHLAASLQAVVFVGGCFGTLARYGIILQLPTQANDWPLATLIANLLGAFILGLLLEALVRRSKDTGKLRALRLGLGTGFVGAFTTYSSLAVEADLLAKSNHISTAIIYALVSVIGGVIFSALGIQMSAAYYRQRVKQNQ